MELQLQDAEEYAAWFRCLADATRLQVLHVVATAAQPVTVGEIVEAVGRGQSTVSHHVQILAEAQFVRTETAGTRTLVSVNTRCMTEFPDAAAHIMGMTPDGQVPS